MTWGDRLTPDPQGVGGFDACSYPVALSSEVAAGTIHGTEFLDGRVIVVRAPNGQASVLSGFCRHYGADLGDGDKEGDYLRCPFHHWKYNLAGEWVGDSVGDRVPGDASLFAFPTQEKWGSSPPGPAATSRPTRSPPEWPIGNVSRARSCFRTSRSSTASASIDRTTRSDLGVMQYLRFVCSYPCAHPSQPPHHITATCLTGLDTLAEL